MSRMSELTGLTIETKFGLHIGYREGTIGYTEGYTGPKGVRFTGHLGTKWVQRVNKRLHIKYKE
jgi:hypothetical protein